MLFRMLLCHVNATYWQYFDFFRTTLSLFWVIYFLKIMFKITKKHKKEVDRLILWVTDCKRKAMVSKWNSHFTKAITLLRISVESTTSLFESIALAQTKHKPSLSNLILMMEIIIYNDCTYGYYLFCQSGLFCMWLCYICENKSIF